MKVSLAFLKTIATRISQYRDDELPEFLLVGRSNVGKSSFINTLLNKRGLARTSSTPGKTQTLNFYMVNNAFYIVDVPGYGYAALNREQQRKMGLMIEEYLEKRQELKRVFMLVDLRIKPTDDDILMYQFLKYYDIPVTIIANKADKVSSSKHDKCMKSVRETLDIVEGDSIIEFSSVSKKGREEVLNLIEGFIVETI